MGFVGPIKWTEADDTDACSDPDSGSGSRPGAGAGAGLSPGWGLVVGVWGCLVWCGVVSGCVGGLSEVRWERPGERGRCKYDELS